ncbi:MAG: hypothetical protein R3C69_16985 [Geminicoccaceae bacterium]
MRIFWTMALTLGTVVGCSSGPETITVYCYETLADSACYFEPDPGHGNRLLAVMEVPLTPEIRLRAGL